ncbi:hypothetical protein XBFFL1_2280018 [Xenorhabdus bovienii str. feltiae Florida]|nr:hypothetical protein XBFFR1_2180049 [Xenorhabdus bovienii str. feltiae France]CDG92690.1 hypothetical protein XBFFL1_2280018 [Xenorhabdus bovienii str. feltiae Florida]
MNKKTIITNCYFIHFILNNNKLIILTQNITMEFNLLLIINMI